MENKRSETVQKWISVKSKLPDEDESVLGLFSGNDVCKFLIEQVSLFEGNFYLDRADGLIDYDDAVFPTHWSKINDIIL